MTKTTLLLLFFYVVCPIHAQTAGNPIQAVGEREWTMGLSGNYMNQEIGNVTAISKRVLVKSAWGVTPWISLYGLLGTVQLSMNKHTLGISDYKDQYRFAYGAGFHVQFDLNPETENGIGLWGIAQVLKYPSKGSFTKTVQYQSSSMVSEFAMKYDCGELMFCAGWIIPIKTVRLYGGGAGWATRRMDTKKEYVIDNDNVKQYIGEKKAEYQSGVWTGGIAGIEFILPQRYAISIEGLVFNRKNYQIMVGICQTGSPDW
jgi:hypothetical protein